MEKELSIDRSLPTFDSAEQWLLQRYPDNAAKLTGCMQADLPLQEPLLELTATSCETVFDLEKQLQPIRDALNQLLPVWESDEKLLTGGLHSVNAVHEMLMHTRKRLAVMHYC